MVNQRIEVTMVDPKDEVINPPAISMSLEINADDNGGKTSFYDTDVAVLRFFTDSVLNYEVSSNIGNASKRASYITLQYTEIISFNKNLEASLTYLPLGSVSYQWIGQSLGYVQVNGKTIRLSNAGTGILKVSYTTRYDLVSISIPRVSVTTEAMIIINQGTDQITSQISFSPIDPKLKTDPINNSGKTQEDQNEQENNSQAEAKLYGLTVFDYATSSPVIGAMIVLDGINKGITDAQGKISLGLLLPGVHTLKISKDGYFSSQNDGLNNDYFTVS